MRYYDSSSIAVSNNQRCGVQHNLSHKKESLAASLIKFKLFHNFFNETSFLISFEKVFISVSTVIRFGKIKKINNQLDFNSLKRKKKVILTIYVCCDVNLLPTKLHCLLVVKSCADFRLS